MTALKWTITTQERNALVETHLGCIWWTINKNRRLISAAGLDDEDVFQQLAIRMIRAVENYDPDKGKDLEQHIFAQLQYEVLNCKDAAKLYGIKGAPYGARDLTVSLDALVETGGRAADQGLFFGRRSRAAGQRRQRGAHEIRRGAVPCRLQAAAGREPHRSALRRAARQRVAQSRHRLKSAGL